MRRFLVITPLIATGSLIGLQAHEHNKYVYRNRVPSNESKSLEGYWHLNSHPLLPLPCLTNWFFQVQVAQCPEKIDNVPQRFVKGLGNAMIHEDLRYPNKHIYAQVLSHATLSDIRSELVSSVTGDDIRRDPMIALAMRPQEFNHANYYALRKEVRACERRDTDYISNVYSPKIKEEDLPKYIELLKHCERHHTWGRY